MTTRNFRVNNGLEVGDIVLNASTNKITGLATAAPSADGDVSNKKYVDDSIAAVSTTAITQLNTNVTVADSGSNGTITNTADGGAVLSQTAATTTVTASGAINLTAGTDVVVPANVGVTFGTGEKIEGDNTDLTVTSGGAINLTAVTDVVVPANVGVTFGTGEKIEGDNTDLTVTSGAKINLAAVSDVHVPQNVGIVFDANGSEKIESNDTDLTINSGAKINLTATSDVHIPKDIGIVFDDNASEKIESNDTDLTISSGAKIKLSATSDVEIPNGVGIAYGTAGEKIESDGTDLTVTSTGVLNLTATGDTAITNNATIGGNLVLTGNLTVNGSTSTVSSVNTTIADNIIELNTGISASSNDAGIIIERGSTGNNAAILWDESADKFTMGTTTATAADKSGGVSVSVSTLVANLEGNVTGDLTGTADVATAVTAADESSDTSCNLLFVTGATGNLPPKTGTNLTFNSSSGVLTATGFAGALTGDVTGTADVATAITAADESSDTSCNVLFVTAATGDLPPKTGTNLTFNSSSGVLTATGFAGDLTGDVTGNADTATVATTVTITDNESTDEDNAMIFTAGGDVDGGNIGLESDGTCTYNPSTGKITATGFVGALTGNASGSSGSCTGNAASATILQNTRAIGGVNFNGSAAINLPGVNTAGNQNTSGTAAIATAVTVTANNTANEDIFICLVDGASGTQGIETDTGLKYNPSTNVIASTASSAQYADVAERFEADAPMEAGSVVMVGGSAEITEITSEMSEDVFGVISHKPAYMMNAGAGSDESHPYVAMTGRTPVRVIGEVTKGQRLVTSSTKGCARAVAQGESFSPFNVIGRALETDTDTNIKLVNCAVRSNN